MKKVRCAIYTRKSSEEGLDQDFNSLHAQREACAAYVLSQASEGWSLLPAEYNDGGLSGGTLERPGLKRLLSDIEAGRIDVVVVYKVDRLTRSLLDFAKLVETMDKAGVSFVSITQSFNTTTSMGRLTLNMLLSFAQFEREVTAERIRDKIAASKAKGMWMGGIPPLGYAPDGRTLKIVEEHATLIRMVFTRYLELGNVRLLKEQLEVEGVLVPERFTASGKKLGGGNFSRGQLYKLLSNPIYIGEIHHKGSIYQGKHQAIIGRDLWQKVQARLTSNTQGEQRAPTVQSPSLLAGKIFDDAGEPLVASHACKGKVRYRYYVSRPAAQASSPGSVMRIPAKEVEKLVTTRLLESLSDPLSLLAMLKVPIDRPTLEAARCAASKMIHKIKRGDARLIQNLVASVRVSREHITLNLDPANLLSSLGLPADSCLDEIALPCSVRLTRSGLAMRLVEPGGRTATPRYDPVLVGHLVKARRWWARLSDGRTTIAELAREEGVTGSWISRVVRLNFLSPQIVDAIMGGSQPADLTGSKLTMLRDFPATWNEQARLLQVA